MNGRHRDRSRRLALLFAAMVVPATAALVWLGVKLLQQDRTLLVQRQAEREQAAQRAVVSALVESLLSAERWLTGDSIPEHAVRVRVTPLGLSAIPAQRIQWLAGAAPLPEAATAEFSEAEHFEYQGSPGRALTTYSILARASSPTVRAGALLRLARMHRRERRTREALAAYRSLAGITDIAIDGIPADLVARRAICDVLGDSGDAVTLAHEAAALDADLRSGRWLLDRTAWELTAAQIEQWSGRVPSQRDPEAVALSLATEWVAAQSPRLLAEPPGRTTRYVGSTEPTVTLLARRDVSGVTVLMLTARAVDAWLQRAASRLPGRPVAMALRTDSGALIAGAAIPANDTSITLTTAQTGLPWTLAMRRPDTADLIADTDRRRQTLFAALAVLVALLLSGSYVIWRAVQRELAVARLQTNFVAAVSHEFRTPLAALRHVTELLQEDDEGPRERRAAFYEVLARNADRLHRLVESLLDFARLENPRKGLELTPVDLVALVSGVVEDFRRDGRADGFTIAFDDEATAVESMADTASLTHALWNLLDNAVKYSGDRRDIQVSIERQPRTATIAVHDNGLGIPRDEQQRIWDKGERGRQAEALGITGTGLGLAIVVQVARAHGGRVEVESEEGVGSTFRLVLPSPA